MPAAKKKTAAPVATTGAVTSPFGVPSERLMKLSVDSKLPDPYVVTRRPDGTPVITVMPLTKKRGTALREAHMSILVYQTLLSEAMRQSNTAPTAPPPDAGEEEAAAYQAAVASWEASIKNNEEVMQALSQNITDAETAYERAFFGDAYDDVMAYFEDQDQKLWDKFVAQIKADFLPAMPTGGICPTCGNVEDQEEVGKPLTSST